MLLFQELLECTADIQELFKAAVISSAAQLCEQKRLRVAPDRKKVIP